MQKSMYSLILSDAVVSRIDQMAYEKGMSRSQLIDQILAGEVGLHTPEQKVRIIIEQVADTIGRQSPLQVTVRSDMGGMQFATYLRYKYNPGIRFQVEFQNRDGHMVGILKVFSRSTSEDLLMHLSRFFTILTAIDKARFEEFHHMPVTISVSSQSSNKFARLLVTPQMSMENADERIIAQYLSHYVMMLDEALKVYFMNLGQSDVTARIDEVYCRYMRDLSLNM